MVRKKKKRDDELPPWCYYCDRMFGDETTLVQHQKAKHFKACSPIKEGAGRINKEGRSFFTVSWLN
jgi:hypothetical protein